VIIIPNIDEQIALENYVREQKEKGYTDEELREELRKAGWDRKLIEEVLKITGKGSDALSGIEKFAKYDKYIHDDETITSVYNIASTKLILTNERLIIVKRFPISQVKMDLKDVEYVEYFTDIKWRSLWISFGCIFGFMFIYMFHEALTLQIRNVLPFLTPALDKKILFRYNILSFLISMTLLGFFVFYGLRFMDSLFGRLRIMIKNQAPVDIVTVLARPVEDFIKEMETLEKNLVKNIRTKNAEKNKNK